MEKNHPRKRRFWIPVILLVAYSALFSWTRQTETTLGPFLLLLAGLLVALLLWLWATFLSGLRPRFRWLSLFSGIATVAFLALTLRNEGSSSGTGIPRLVWKWTPTIDEQSRSLLAEMEENETPPDANTEEKPLSYLALDSLEFYGQNRNGIIEGLSVQTESLDEPLSEVWKQPIGLGWGGYAVTGRIAITQEQRGEEEWVTAYDLETGALKWHYAKQRRFSEGMGGDGPRATPIIVGETVYAIGATGVLDALNISDGTHQWSHEALGNGGSNLTWGKAASPLYLEEQGLVVVTGGTSGGPTIQAVSADYGEPVWNWGNETASYSSPVLASIHGENQLISVNESTVVGLSPATGKLAWSFDIPKGSVPNSAKVGQPSIIDESKVLVTASYGVGAMLFDIVKAEDGSYSTSLIWHVKNRMKTKFSSACVQGNYAYGLDEGRLACIDLANGKRLWKDGKYGYGQNILVNGTLIIQAEDGDIAFVEANPEAFNELARFPGIQGKTWNIPTLAGEYLLIRNDHEAACYRIPARPIDKDNQ